MMILAIRGCRDIGGTLILNILPMKQNVHIVKLGQYCFPMLSQDSTIYSQYSTNVAVLPGFIASIMDTRWQSRSNFQELQESIDYFLEILRSVSDTYSKEITTSSESFS